MRKCNNNLVAADLRNPPGGGNISRRYVSRLTAPPLLVSSWGFAIPALIVCAALWFLLSGTRPL